jgi:hypothetical protein
MIIDLLERFDPEPDGLLDSISAHIDDEMLKEISLADYGDDAAEHLTALRTLRDAGIFPAKMVWVPGEVLELIRWSEPEVPEWKPGRTGEFGHWMRAFCCAALLRATREPWNYGDGVATESTVAQLTISLGTLSVDFTSAAVKFLSWLLLNSDPEGRDGQVCSYSVSLLWFALHLPSLPPNDDLISLADWTMRRADELYVGPPNGNRGLREMVVTCQKSSAWETIGLELLDLCSGLKSSVLQSRVRAIAEQILD